MCRALLVASLVCVVGVPPVSATSFSAVYSFNASPGDQASEPIDDNPVGATFSDITRGPGITASAGLNSMNSADWTTAASADLNDYYQWIITPSPGFALDVSGLDFTFRRSLNGPRNFELRSSADGFTMPFASVMVGDVDINFRVGFFSGPSFDSMLDLVAPLTIRLYAYAAEESAGTFRLGIDTNSFGSNQPDNLVVSGDLSQVADAVPEPTSLVLLGSALAGVAVRRRRRRDR